MRPRWLYFSLFASFAHPGSFQPLFFSAHGLSPSQIGLLQATTRLLALFFTPFICAVSDRISKPELVIAVIYSLATLFSLAQLLVLPSLNLLPSYAHFPLLVALRVPIGALSPPVFPILSALTVTSLNLQFGPKGHHRFGNERLRGSVSYATCSLVLGLLLDRAGIWVVHVGHTVYGIIFLAVLAVYARRRKRDEANAKRVMEEKSATADPAEREDGSVDSASANKEDRRGEKRSTLRRRRTAQGVEPSKEEKDAAPSIPAKDEPAPAPDWSKSSQPVKARPSFFQAAAAIMRHGGWHTAAFFYLKMWQLVGSSLMGGLLFLHIRKELSASNSMLGLAVVARVVFEIPLFAVMPRLLRVHGPERLALFAAMTWSVRALVHSTARKPWMVLLVEPLHGVTFAMSKSSSVSYVSERMPKELEASGQALLSVLGGVAGVVSSVVGGWVMQHYGGAKMYRAASLAVLSAAVVFAFVERRRLFFRERLGK